MLWFLLHGAEVDPVDRMGTTPIFVAAEKVPILWCFHDFSSGWTLVCFSRMTVRPQDNMCSV